MRAAAAKTSKGVARRTNGGGVNARSRLIISNTKTLATARALRSPSPSPPPPPSSLVIKAASGREKLTHYDLHKNLIPGRRRIPVMQNGSGLALASNRALVVMSFGERLVAAPACVNYVSLFLSFIKFGIFRLQGSQGTGQRCTNFAGNRANFF